MPELHVTYHAIQRYQERIANLVDEDVIEILSGPAVQIAANFGAQFVRLASGHRIVLNGHTVVSVLPADHFRKQVLRVGLGRFGATSQAHRRGYHDAA